MTVSLPRKTRKRPSWLSITLVWRYLIIIGVTTLSVNLALLQQLQSFFPQTNVYPVSWHTNYFDVEKDDVILEGSFIDSCLAAANEKNIKPFENFWYTNRIPQFSSVVLAPPMYNNMTHFWHVIFNTANLKTAKGEVGIRKRYRSMWMKSSIWSCDGLMATTVGRGCPNGETLIVRCPQLGHDVPPQSIAVRNTTYYIGDHIKCYKNHSFRKPKPNGVVANLLIFDEAIRRPRRLVEWVEYHRLIGLDHVFVYYMGSYKQREQFIMPKLPYITYIPFDLMNYSNFDDLRDAFRFQSAQQVDAIFRARGLGYSWILMTDMDEYLRFGNISQTLRDLDQMFLTNNGNATRVGGLSIQSCTYGSAHGEPKFPELMIDHIWKRRAMFVGERQKAIVRPDKVNYFAVHGITSGGPELGVDPAILRLNHYRHAEQGVSLSRKPGEDQSMKELFHDQLKKRVDIVWALIKSKYNVSSDDLWSTETAFRNYHDKLGTGQHSTQ